MTDFSYKDYIFKCDIGTMTPTQYIKLIDMLENIKPKRICELGSGQSTNIIKHYCQKTNAQSFSIEHDAYYNTHNSIMLPWIEDTSLNIQNHYYEKCGIYDGFEKWLEKQQKFDFVLIDGPNDGLPTNPKNLIYSRIQTIDFVLMDKLQDNSILMFHDNEREISKNTLNEFQKLLKQYNFSFQTDIIIEKENKQIIDYNINVLGTCPELIIYKITTI